MIIIILLFHIILGGIGFKEMSIVVLRIAMTNLSMALNFKEFSNFQ